MKKLLTILTVLICICLFAGCAGTPVIYHTDCNCPTEGGTQTPAPEVSVPDGSLKTGLAVITSIKDSTSAAENDGEAKYDVTAVAVLADKNGVIQACEIDSINTSIVFDSTGKITTDLGSAIPTKNELGENYPMPSGTWQEQAAALAAFAVGKTVSELKSGAIDESGKAPAGSDLASSATIYLGGYVSAIERAVSNAAYLGAMEGDELRLATLANIKSSTSAGENDGTAKLDADFTALTLKNGKITSCAIDSVQANVSFDTSGSITSDLSAAVKSKNELGTNYGMVAWGGAIAEWNEQAASFAKYVTGKIPAEVAGISVDEGTKPTGADLTTSVTIAIGGFQALIAKAAQ